jgi:NTE family protein
MKRLRPESTILVQVLLAAFYLTVASSAAAQTALQAPATPRPRVGVALGGGSARGLAHVGVLKWLEEHRIPIDVLSGTSMGGLIGGSYAAGLTPPEIEAMLAEVDWDTMFGRSGFEFANVRRKRDLRSYPSHLEFGLKNGLAPPSSLNNGQQVDLFLARIAAPYYGISTFDDLPTPFRCVAVDLKTARFVVLDRGSLATAMRATMSLPLIFPAIEDADRLLVDGGAMNNVPADVARQMGADKVIAVNVGDLTDRETVSASLFGLAGATLDAMMRANTLQALKAADVVINVPVTNYGSLDWRRFRDLIQEGYGAAEAMKDQLLPLAVSEAAWQQWSAQRAAARREEMPTIGFVEVSGAASSDTDFIRRAMAKHQSQPLDAVALAATLTELGGLDRYESLRWSVRERDGMYGLFITAFAKPYAPPFLFLGVSLENTTANEFRFGLNARYLAFDKVSSGSELRVDGALGSDPALGMALYKPIFTTRLFVEPFAGISSRTFNVVQDGRIQASYRQTRSVLGFDGGVNVSRIDEARVGVTFGRFDASVRTGDPGLPQVGGSESRFHAQWTHDDQDIPVVPSHGLRFVSRLEHFLNYPDIQLAADPTRKTDGVTQFETAASWFTSKKGARASRAFLAGGFGTSFGGHPLPTEQFPIGGLLRLGAFDAGEERGDKFVLTTAGYLRQVARLPDFVGGPLFLGSWIEGGSAFDEWEHLTWSTNLSLGVIADTIIGPVFAGFSFGFEGGTRFYIAIGQLFR